MQPASSFSTHLRGEVLVVERGIEPHDVPRLVADLAGLESRGGAVDLSGVGFLPTLAVQELVRARKRCRQQGTALRLVAAEGTVARTVLSAVGLEVHEP